jgi:hypothetical protein
VLFDRFFAFCKLRAQPPAPLGGRTPAQALFQTIGLLPGAAASARRGRRRQLTRVPYPKSRVSGTYANSTSIKL